MSKIGKLAELIKNNWHLSFKHKSYVLSNNNKAIWHDDLFDCINIAYIVNNHED